MMNNYTTNDEFEGNIAIIGMSGRFPGAKNIDEFWQNLKNGVESITFFSDQELINAGIKPSVLKDSNYVKAKGILDNVAEFDATFFGLSPKEAEITDPQQRLFLECAWEALENAGYDPQTYSGAIGLYGGMSGIDSYFSKNLLVNQTVIDSTDKFQLLIGNDKDFLCTRISYKLNLNGPSITVQTACSTSLVAVAMACKSLLTYQCDIVLAGGVAISLPAKSGYLYREGMILSPDGHCRAFDAKAQGTVPSNGVGIVVLKRAEEAIAERDHIYAIIKGTAINNDGTLKVGYTAPSVEGQMQVITEALAFAETSAKTISYVETHGTGTALGDPIEIAALTKVFRAETDQKNYCAIGSVKTNIGHLDIAAGIAGLIKTVLALEHQLLPPSLHFNTPNSKLDLDNSPFYVNTQLSAWKTDDYPRRAGVSAFGIGGTNAHVILEEAPRKYPYRMGCCGNEERNSQNTIKSNRPWQLLLLSAKTDTALETATNQLVEHLKQHPNLDLADVAYTYQVGRQAFNHRRMLVCKTLEDAIHALSIRDAKPVISRAVEDDKEPAVVFMFSGQGSQYVDMGLELYLTEPLFRERFDRYAEFLKPHIGIDLREVLYPTVQRMPQEENIISPKFPFYGDQKGMRKNLGTNEFSFDKRVSELNQTAITQPVLFVIEYTLAQLWMAWGIQPKAMIGHSIGEYVAACLAGVFTLEEALMLVVARGQLMQSVPPGAMLAVPLSEAEIQPLLNKNIDLAAINMPSQCVVSGNLDAMEKFDTQLAQQGIECQRLHTSHAFHSEMMAPILAHFLEQVQKIDLKPPKIPFISNVTGTWISNSEATDPNYWVNHIRQTVRFAAGLQKLLKEPAYMLLEIGPGRTLSTLAKRHPNHAGQLVLTSLRHPKDEQSDSAFLLKTLGQLWLAGITVNWAEFQVNEQRYRLPLPTYPFERQRYWIEPQTQVETVETQSNRLHKKPDIADWFYIPSWKRTASMVYDANTFKEPLCWLVFMDECGLGSQLLKRLQQQNQDVITVTVGEQLSCDAQKYTLNPHRRDDYDALLRELLTQNKCPQRIIHLWTVTPNNDTKSGKLEWLEYSQNIGFDSLFFLAQAIGTQNLTEALQITVVSNHIQEVTGDEILAPEKATVLGTVKVIPQEYPNISCRSIDIVLPELETATEQLIDNLVREILTKPYDPIIAYRGTHRWLQTFEPVRLDPPMTSRLREKGIYLITGGLGGMGLTLAEYLAKTVQAKLILIGRSTFPLRTEWEQWLMTHEEQDNISIKIRKLQQLEKSGAEILVRSADVANYEQMQAVITEAQSQFGQINGILHTAGLADYGGVIHKRARETSDKILAPKVRGTLILHNLLKETQLDFSVLFSSIGTILYKIKFGEVAYCAANEFLDAFTHYKKSRGDTFTVTINWNDWQKVGMSVGAEKHWAKTHNVEAQFWSIDSLLPAEGVEVFKRVLANNWPRLLVLTQDLTQMFEQASNLKALRSKKSLEKKLSNAYSRPQLSQAYVAPRNDKEQTMAKSWQTFFGIEKVGIHDDFFELGGDSLLAVQLISKLRKTFQINLSPHILFEAPTIATLAELIEHLPSTSSKDSWQEVGIAVEAAKQHAGTLNLHQKPQYKAVNHPLFDKCIVDEQTGTETYISHFQVSKYWVLSEHKVMEKPTLPGTAYLEMARAAVENNYKNNGIIEFKEVYFLALLTVKEDEEKEVRTILTKRESGFEFVVLSQANSGGTWQEYARGQITYIAVEMSDKYDLKAFEEKCSGPEIVFSQDTLTTSAGFMEYGPRWNNLKQIKLGPNQGLALLELPNSLAADMSQYQLHPALLDVAIGFTLVKNEQAYLPFFYKILRIKGPLPAKIYSYITWVDKNHSADTLTLNIKIMDEQGQGLVEIEDYTLRRVNVATDKSEKQLSIPECNNFHLEITSPGILDTLTFCSATRKKPSLGEVEIEIGATGLNFKEVLLALGMFPVQSNAPIPFGLECAGKIVAIGENVDGFQIGDEVVAYTGHGSSFSAYTTISTQFVILKPHHLSLEHAATIPVVFMTAYYALHHLARLCQGERVLIHAATGGVGLAAVQMAQRIGAEIFATAGNSKKQAFLHSLGIEHVMSSRTLAFADDVMERTNGQGVNVVLNSLGGEFIPKSLSVLTENGRFLELGLRDIYENNPLYLRHFEKGLSFFAINPNPDSPLMSFLFQEVMQHFNNKNFSPLPHKVFPITEVAEAFKYMAQAKHIGKIVVSQQDKLAANSLVSKVSIPQSEPVYKQGMTQVEISAHSFLEKPTLATLAESIQPMATNGILNSQILPPSLVRIQSGNNTLKRTIFLVHPAGGHVYIYRDLACCLGHEQPIYGLQAQDIGPETASQTPINQMATRYIEALRTVQSEGPYLLGGASFGGVVAFEMAQQLHAIGQQVALLALIDAPGPGYLPVEFEDDVDILAYLLMVGDNDSSVSAEQIRHLNPDERIKYFLAHGKKAKKLLLGQTLEEFCDLFGDFMRMFQSNLQALRDYRVKQIYPGKIIFFRATEPDEFNHPNPERGWFDLAQGGVEVHEVPGNHITMNYLPHVEVIAKQLKTYLD